MNLFTMSNGDGGGTRSEAGRQKGFGLFYRLSGVVYLLAFVSMYIQWPVLFGDNGLLPCKNYAEQLLKHHFFEGDAATNITRTTTASFLMKAGTAIPMAFRDYGFHIGALCDFALLLGLLSSMLIIYFGDKKLSFIFHCISWFTYVNLKNVGQTFYNFQWDSLLLEFGFLCIITSFLDILYNQSDRIYRWAYRFLAFKLMILSGAAKLQAQCPTWNKLTALEYHFATQCLPTSIAWFAHQLPPLILRFGVAMTLLLEMPLTFLLVVPVHNLRVSGAFLQILLQLLIFATGSYNFFNILTAILMIPSFYRDPCDIELSYFLSKFVSLFRKKNSAHSDSTTENKHKNDSFLDNPLVLFFWLKDHLISAFIIVFASFRSMFFIKFHEDFRKYWWLGSQISLKHTWEVINNHSALLSILGVWCCILMVIVNSVREIYSIIFVYGEGETIEASSDKKIDERKFIIPRSELDGSSLPVESSSSSPLSRSFKRMSTVTILRKSFCLLLSSLLALIWIVTSAVGLQSIWPITGSYLPIQATKIYRTAQPFSTFNSYGLFRRMTGVGTSLTAVGDSFRESVPVVQRPELVIEALHPVSGKWIELEFLYKPGAVDRASAWAAPYQPRVDWQMWFAALGEYQSNPFLVNLLHKLLSSYENENKATGHPEINSLFLNFEQNFKGLSPKEVRVNMYHYDFTKWETDWSQSLSPVNAVFVNSTYKNNQWWKRAFVKEYLPALQVENPSVKAFLQNFGIYSEKYVTLEQQVRACDETSERFESSSMKASLSSNSAVLRAARSLSCDAMAARPVIEYVIYLFSYYFVNVTSFIIIFFTISYTYVKDKRYLGL